MILANLFCHDYEGYQYFSDYCQRFKIKMHEIFYSRFFDVLIILTKKETLNPHDGFILLIKEIKITLIFVIYIFSNNN
jgi:hypothetical protein